MPYSDLQTFLTDLEARGHLRRVAVEVDPILEISAIADRVSKSPAVGNAAAPPADPIHGGLGGCALLFENVKGSTIPVAINVGDYLVGKGYELVASAAEEVGSERITAILRRLSRTHVCVTKGQGEELVGEVLQRVGWIRKHLGEDGKKVRGIVLCEEPPASLSYAAAAVSDTITFKTYRIALTFEDLDV